MQQRQRVGKGLTAPGLGHPDHRTPREEDRDREGLDLGWRGEALVGEGGVQRGEEREVGEGGHGVAEGA
jgi:hypothetical protein